MTAGGASPEFRFTGAEPQLGTNTDEQGALHVPHPLVVLGDTPALRGFDLHRLAQVHTIGLNTAYRQWQKLNWYPTYYCYLDLESIHEHADAISQLVGEGRIQRFLLRASILDRLPELAQKPGVEFLDAYLQYCWEAHARRHGLDRKASVYFESCSPNDLITAAYAVRWSLELGYRRVGLLGIACPDQTRTHRGSGTSDDNAVNLKHRLHPTGPTDRGGQDLMDSTTTDPNCRSIALHPFRTLCEDLLGQTEYIKIFNLDAASQLHIQGLFPYATLEDFSAERLLGAVVCPLIPHELPRAIESLKLWDQCAYAPYQTLPVRPSVDLIYSFNVDEDNRLVDQLNAAFNATKIVRRCFHAPRFVFCDLRGEQDVYNRTATGVPGVGGYKAGPNNLFFETFRRLNIGARYMFQMETDCWPTRPGWLADLERVCERHNGAWVIGSYYRGCGLLGRAYMRHINGNAIYGIGIPEFREFFWDILKPWVDRIVAEVDPLLAYDCAWDLFLQQANPVDPGDPYWPHVQQCLNKFQYTDTVANIGGAAEQAGKYTWSLGDVRRQFPACAIVHGPVELGALPMLVAPRKAPAGPIPLPDPLEDSVIYVQRFLGAGRTQLAHQRLATIEGERSTDYCSLIFGHRDGPLCAGDVIKTRLTVSADKKRHASFMVARHGDGPWESSTECGSVGPRSKTIEVSHTVLHEHELFRIQVAPAIRWSKPVVARFEGIRIEVSRDGLVIGTYTLNRSAPGRSGSEPGFATIRSWTTTCEERFRWVGILSARLQGIKDQIKKAFRRRA